MPFPKPASLFISLLMQNRFIIIFLLLLISCQSKQNASDLQLFSNVTMRLLPGEKLIPVTPEIKTNFFSHFSNINIQLPLFKFIKTNVYSMYLGLPLNASIANMRHSPLAINDSNCIYFKSDSVSFLYRNYFNKSTYITEFVKDVDKNILYLLCETPSKKINDSLFSLESISGRINTYK